MHLKTIKSKQVKVKSSISQMLKEILEEMHGIETCFMPQLRHNMDSIKKQVLHNAMMKHQQVLANLVEFKLKDFEEIYSPIRNLENKTFC